MSQDPRDNPDQPPSRRKLGKLLAGAAALGLGLGVTPKAEARGGVPIRFVVNGRVTHSTVTLPVDIEDALVDGDRVEAVVQIGHSTWRANFKVEIEG